MDGWFYGWDILGFIKHIVFLLFMCSPKKLESEIVNPLFLDNLCMCTDCYGSNCNLFKESMEMYLVRLSRLLNIEITRWFWEKFPFLQLCNKFQSKFFIMKLSSPTKNAGFMVGYQTCRSLVFNHSKQQVSWLQGDWFTWGSWRVVRFAKWMLLVPEMWFLLGRFASKPPLWLENAMLHLCSVGGTIFCFI